MNSDTSREAARVQAEAHRRMGASRRLELAFRMSSFVRALAEARIRAKNPGYDPTEVRDRLIWELYGVRRGSR
jgi:hypothetical protein